MRWLCAIMIGLVLAGCAAPRDDSGPIDAARGFVAALEARDVGRVIGLLEPSDWRPEVGPELRSSLGLLSALELRDAGYEALRNDGRSAQVRISGTVAYSLAESGAGGEHPVDLRVEMVRVGDSWYLRSLDLPQAAAGGRVREGVARPEALPFAPQPALAQGAAPDDPLYRDQWALDRVGAPCAWQITTGREDLIVAVVDSGVDFGHPDLQGRLRKDGYDFVDNDGDPRDENGHGTHVTGIIAASLGNAEGGAGLAPTVQILPVRVVNAAGVGGDSRIAAGIDYALRKGARVINLSIGSTLLLATPDFSSQITAAIGRAADAGAVVVVAAGNDFLPLPNAIVGLSKGVIVVAASTRDDRRAVFSNYGPWVGVAAPGEHILSTMPTYPVFLTSPALPEEERFQQGYDYMSGSSQAAPFVSALAALLLSQRPDWGVDQVTAAIEDLSFNIYQNMPSLYRRLRLLGGGRIDACAALSGAPPSSGPLSPLALGLVMAGLLLLAVGSTWALRARRRPARGPAAGPAPEAPEHIGDTLVAAGAPWGRLLELRRGKVIAEHALRTPSAVLGRSVAATITIRGDPRISRAHARLSLLAGRPQIVDLDSAHGTLVNGRAIAGPTTLHHGDLITLGDTTLRYE